jgi:hypothetical protein
MTAAEFRRLALALPGVTESSHMDHPDFRVGGKIFATLGYPDAGFGTVIVSPPEQDFLVQRHPRAFAPGPGAWGSAGGTSVKLAAAPRRAVALALESAWSRRAPKKLRAQYAAARLIAGVRGSGRTGAA